MRRYVFVVCVSSAACGLFPDLTGLSDDASVDASSFDVHVDVASVDAASDATITDANGSDAKTDADAGDSGATGFCATHPGHTFCEDFDEPNFAARWTGVVTNPSGATADESDASSVSAPNELLATTTFPVNSAAANAFAYKHFATATTLKVQVQLQVDANGLPQIDPLEIVFTPPPSGYTSYEIHIDTGDGHLGYSSTPDGGTNTNVDTNFAAPLTSWHEVELDFNATTAMVQVFLDGVSVVSWKIAPTSPAAFDLKLGVVKGLGTATAATTGRVHVDNVLVDTK